ncbi:MAG TPA: SMP-30/gluconolactonase/LRE family protein [Thermoanaerobaculia bacterium]|nr:SMP-30/gluconolactonase/LRE family protein [Thermoanaerobaculia bacterium]
MRRMSMAGLVLLILAVAYLLAWPVPIRPVAWQAPAAPPAAGPYAPNERLHEVELLGRGVALGPESTAIDAGGRVFTGTSNGRILRLDPASRTVVTIAATGGRPLGMAFEKSGTLLICDADKGLLALSPSGALHTLVTQYGGAPLRFTNDVDVAPDGMAYFTDTSPRFGIREVREAILEHGGGGRLMSYDPATGKVILLLSDLQFANGVAVSGDGSFVLVAETGAYRVTRYWLAGPRRGTSEPFIENLPGLPDNVTWSAQRRAFWIALYSPRIAALDLLASHQFLRRIVYRLPLWIQPQPARHAWALAVDEQGKVVANLQDTSPDSFAPVTSVRERNGTLWLGSLEREALGRIKAPPIP